jgi:hypothetical protein
VRAAQDGFIVFLDPLLRRWNRSSGI